MHEFIFSNNKQFIDVCLSNGVDQFIVDLERTGKLERQLELNSFISDHTMHDVQTLISYFGPEKMIVRIDFLSPDFLLQIEELSALGVINYMVPMFDKASEIEKLVRKFESKKFIPLVETAGAFQQLNELVNIPLINSFHIGLNDLSLQLYTDSMFDVVLNGVLKNKIQQISTHAVYKWGFGGVGSSFFDHKVMPIEVLRHHQSLGSTQVILTRDFMRLYELEGVSKLRSALICLNEEMRKIYDENY